MHVRSTVANIVTGGGDLHVHEKACGYEFGALDQGTPDDALRGQPSRLLAAAQQIVPFQGRSREIALLAQWRDDASEFGVVLIHGVGGEGKTRVATQFAALSSERGWVVVAARSDPLFASEQRLTDDLPTGPVGRLVVIDYAERWPVKQLRAILTDARLRVGRNRVLLLSRPAGRWWAGVRADIRRVHRVRAKRLPLEPFDVGSGDREKVFIAARDAFAIRLHAGRVADLTPPDTWPRTATALDIHMAALALVFARARKDDERGLTDPAALSSYLLERETDYWTDLHRDAGMTSTPESMARTVFLASLAGAMTHDAAVEVLIATGLAARGQESMRLIDDHRTSYPALDANLVLSPLYPDRLAEDFIALELCGGKDYEQDPWALNKVAALLPVLATTAPHRAVSMLLIIISIAQRWNAVARDHLGPLLRAHPAAFLAGGGSLLTGLVEVTELEPATLAEFEAAMPVSGSPDLMDPLAVLSERLYLWLIRAHAPADEVEPLRFRLARRLFHANRHDQALPHLHALNSEGRGVMDRALVLGYLARAYAALGRSREARTAAEQALELYRGEHRSRAATPEVAALLDVYARLLFGFRQTAAAVGQQLAAAELWRRLCKSTSIHLADYAASVDALGRYQDGGGRHQDAVDSAQLAVALWRKADAATPGVYRVEMLEAILRIACSRLFGLPDRLAAATEAARGFEEVWRGNIALVPRAAAAIQLFASVLNEAGRSVEAVTPSRNAYEMFDLLADQDTAFRPARANAAVTYARAALGAQVDLEGALAAARAAAKFYRTGGDRAGRETADRSAAGLLRALGRDQEADDLLARLGPSRPRYEGVFERQATVSRRMDTSARHGPCQECGGTGLVSRVVDNVASGRWVCMFCKGSGVRT